MVLKNTKKYIENKKSQNLYGVDFDILIHPGETLKDELEFFGISQKELAKKIGYSPQTINRIIKGKEPITTDVALALERVFDGRPSAQFWLNMQSEYDKGISKKNEFKETQKEIKFFLKNIKQTLKELQKKGIFDDYSLNSQESYKKSIISIKDFFGSHSLQSIKEESLLGVPFRRYKKENTNLYNLAAILKIGEKEARKILKENTIPEYNKVIFAQRLSSFKKLVNKKPKEFLRLLQKECLKIGVIVVYVPNISNTYFGGATVWINKYPVILLKMENQYEDIFWFNFFHEAGHILKHGKKEVFINFDLDKNDKNDKIEKEADNFASNLLMSNFENTIKEIGSDTSKDDLVKILSQKYSISKSIVAGRLCFLLSSLGVKDVWQKMRKYRPRIKEKVVLNY